MIILICPWKCKYGKFSMYSRQFQLEMMTWTDRGSSNQIPYELETSN